MLNLRDEFAIFRTYPDLIYLDNSTTTQRPQYVIDAINDFFVSKNANTGRGNYKLAERADQLLADARKKVAGFVGADINEIIFTSNVTSTLNLISYAFLNDTLSFGPLALTAADEIVLTQAEHHANLIPWQKLAHRTGAKLRWLKVDPSGRIRIDRLEEIITSHTKIVAFTHLSNVTGAITDVQPIIQAAHQVGAITVLDACQSVPHLNVNFHDLDIDFAGFSGHKMFASFGTGVWYGKSELLEQLQPVVYGGGIVEDVTLETSSFVDSPLRFESGTKNFDSIYSLMAAIEFIEHVGRTNLIDHEYALTEKLLEIQNIDGIRILGPTDHNNRIGVVAFTVEGVHPHDVAQFFDSQNICVRAGHHCTKPLHRIFGVPASVRASVSAYNSLAEIDQFIETLSKVRGFFGV
ncbi:MAG: SufS family cysteine desulfurase [Bifidobacteriaceae bacterium]|jgi:cysteine desulfurase/selenocysteine lyase|nr:SufS family cysteine desulfurase [Bifidobacteriaceae bacterium]